MKALALLFLALMRVGPAQAWGPEGHAIVAEIAEARLTPAARGMVARLLALEGHRHLDEIASWADAYHADHPETGPWHFVDIPLEASGYDAARDCPAGDCIVVKLQEVWGALDDRALDEAERLTALKYLVHFVGDIHQPLHCADRHDRGGNDLKLVYAGQPTNLHAVWDLGLIETALHTSLGPNWAPDLGVTQAEAKRLNASITPAEAAAWAPKRDPVIVWANEAHALARPAYQRLGSADYDQAEWPVVEEQLQRAGARLADILIKISQKPDAAD